MSLEPKTQTQGSARRRLRLIGRQGLLTPLVNVGLVIGCAAWLGLYAVGIDMMANRLAMNDFGKF